MIRLIGGCVTLVLLGGCASWETLQTSVAMQGAKAADEQLEVARWSLCEAPTAGALRRRYAQDPDGLRAWQMFCSRPSAAAVAP